VAAGWLERVARSDPRYFEARFFLGLCRYLSGDLKGAEECFQVVAAELPLNEVYNDLGAAQAQRQDYSDAETNFRKAREGDDTDPDFHFNLGVALWRGGKFSEAAESFRAVLARNAGDAEATTLLGRCLKNEPLRVGDTRSDGKLRIKTNYEESAFRQLQAELKKK
jgi:tetratricopeptide (TPR) repeat protein